MSEKIVAYLKECGVNDGEYFSFLIEKKYKDLNFKLCSVDGFDFIVSHFFDDSTQSGYGLIKTNDILKKNGCHFIGIGLIEGDDVLCINSLTGTIHVWLIQTGNGEYIEVSRSFKSFIEKCVSV